MTFATYISRTEGDFSVFPYVYISGIGAIFSNRDEPAKWSGLLGTDRTWSRSLVFFRAPGSGSFESSFSSVSQKTDLKSGVLVSGQLELEFAVDAMGDSGTWRDLLVPTTRESYYLDTEILKRPGMTAWTFLDATGIEVGDFLYGGLETIKVTSIASAPVIEATGGQFDSPRLWRGHRGPPTTNLGGVPEFTSWSKTMKGRLVELWIETCEGTTPTSAAPRGTGSKNIFRGVVTDMNWGPDGTSIRLQVQSIEQLLERPVLSRGRQYRLGPDAPGYVYVEAGGPRLVEVVADDYWLRMVATGGDGRNPDLVIDCLTDLGGAGLYHIDTILSNICISLNEHFIDDVGGGATGNFYRFTWIRDPDEPSKIAITAYHSIGGVVGPHVGTIRFKLTSANSPSESILPAFGCTEDLVLDGANRVALPPLSHSYATCQEPPPHHYIGPGNSRIYWRGNEAESFFSPVSGDPPTWPGTSDRLGAWDHCAIRLGKTEIVTGDFRQADGTQYYDATTGAAYIEVVKRGCFGTSASPITVTAEDYATGADSTRLYAGLGFENHDLFDVLRWLAISTGDHIDPVSDWDVLDEGLGAGIPEGCFDLASFDNAQAVTGAIATNLFLDKKTTLRDLFRQVGRAYGVTFTPKTTLGDDGISRYAIAAVPVVVPPLGRTADFTITSGWLSSVNHPSTLDRKEREVVNNVLFEFDRDWLEGKYRGKDDRFVDGTSIENYGESSPLKIELPWLRAWSDAYVALTTIAGWIFAEYGQPPILIEIPCVRPEAWNIELLDTISFTHPYLPNFKDGGIGLSDVRLQVIGKKDEFGPSAKLASTLTCLWRNVDGVFRPYVPCLRLSSWVSDSTYTVEEDSDTGGFSRPGAALTDIEHYSASGGLWQVSCYIPGVDAHQERDVTSVDTTANTITLSTVLTGDLQTVATTGWLGGKPASVVVTFVEYDDAGLDSTQEEYVFLADDTTLLVTNSAAETKPATRWW